MHKHVDKQRQTRSSAANKLPYALRLRAAAAAPQGTGSAQRRGGWQRPANEGRAAAVANKPQPAQPRWRSPAEPGGAWLWQGGAMLGCPAAAAGREERRAWLRPRESSSKSPACPSSGGCSPPVLPSRVCEPRFCNGRGTNSSLLVASAQNSTSPGDMAEQNGESGGSARPMNTGQFLSLLTQALG